MNEIRWNGKGYNINGDLEFEIKNAEGTVKEYDICGFLEYEGWVFNGKRRGKGREYEKTGKIIFEGEYRNGLKHGKGIEYYNSNRIKSEWEYRKEIK